MSHTELVGSRVGSVPPITWIAVWPDLDPAGSLLVAAMTLSAQAESRSLGCSHGRRFEIVEPSDARTLSRFLDADGRLVTIPSKHSKRLVVLDHLAQSFELGIVYPEDEVNVRLGRFHPDVAALRRYLVDEHFLTRRDGFYWRSGGSVDIDGV
ncbi:hypothetical protein GCM10009798_06300 [Nocardioides panacihumi]|uniref:DUF2087 domain-containing protein n=1 Tax=Nocardioides panacihumi TaxID=400774 RepID=A0ABP5BNY0_9ACTN